MSDKNYYLNPNVKKINIKEEYTKEQIAEYIKCSQDPIYFIEKYVKIITLDKGLMPLILRGYQKEFILCMHENRFSIVLAARQSAKTTTVAAYILWYVLFNPEKSVGILANKAATAREILSRITLALENIPFFLQPGVETLNKGDISFGNKSKIFTSATSNDSIRGRSPNFVYIDEYSYVPNAEEFFKATFPTVSSGTESKVVISSTPKGLNHFYKLWKDAKDGRNEFVPFEITWDQVPGRDQNWKKTQIEIMGENGFRQEFGNEFLGSSDTLIAGHVLQSLTWETFKCNFREFNVLEDPKEGRNYVITVDSSRGVGGDYSVAIVIDTTEVPYKIVATFRNNEIRPLRLPQIIIDTAKRYNDAFLLIERNNIGSTVAESCYWDYDYENIFTTISGKKGQELRNSFVKSNQIGVEMTPQVKRIGAFILKTLIEEFKLINLTEEIVSELYSFSSKKDSWSAEPGKHDDLVMSLLLFSWATTQPFFKEITNSDLRKAILEEREDEFEELYTFAGIQDGKNRYDDELLNWKL